MQKGINYDPYFILYYKMWLKIHTLALVKKYIIKNKVKIYYNIIETLYYIIIRKQKILMSYFNEFISIIMINLNKLIEYNRIKLRIISFFSQNSAIYSIKRFFIISDNWCKT